MNIRLHATRTRKECLYETTKLEHSIEQVYRIDEAAPSSQKVQVILDRSVKSNASSKIRNFPLTVARKYFQRQSMKNCGSKDVSRQAPI